MNLKQKAQATFLLLFSFAPFGLLFGYFDSLSKYIESFKGDTEGYLAIPQSLKIFYNIGEFIFQDEILFGLFFITIFCLLIILLYPLTQKILNRISRLLNGFYFPLFGITIALFLKTSYEIYRSNSLTFSIDYLIIDSSKLTNLMAILKPLLMFSLLFSYIESVWNFRKKSPLRKYFISLFFIFSTLFWYTYHPNRRMMEFSSDDLIINAVFFYLISLIIAAVEYIRNRKSKLLNNQAVFEQPT